MSFEIENRVSKSPIQSIDLSDFLVNKEFYNFDIRNWLKDDLILIEKDFAYENQILPSRKTPI